MKVLIINPLVPDYRIPIFNLIAQKVDLTILHSGQFRKEDDCYFKQMELKLLKIGPFIFSKDNLNNICNNYDIVISEGNIRYLDRNLLIINPLRKYKWITWGIGVSASYEKRIGENTSFDFLRYSIFRRADAHIFYSSFPISRYLCKGFNEASLFVANNTTAVNFEKISHKKDILLFVGTLYKQKNIYNLLDSYHKYSIKSSNPLSLFIIGSGPELHNIKVFLKLNKLEKHVFLLGSIFDQNILKNYFARALACISPGQAGLSVLTSMGYGTPYITKRDAITGGEIFNIIDKENGVLYNHDGELVDILFDIENYKKKYIKYGDNARNFYADFRKPELMANEFINACQYVLK